SRLFISGITLIWETIVKQKMTLAALIWLLLVINLVAGQTPQPAKEATAKVPRPIEVADIANWKRMQQPTVSNNGEWFAHRVIPNEGDSEVVVRRMSDGKEWRFPAGETTAFAPLVFSEDSKWLAFATSPSAKETRKLKKDRKPIVTKTVLLNLATQQKVEFEKIRRFAFSGEQAGWLALHRNGAEAAAPPTPS